MEVSSQIQSHDLFTSLESCLHGLCVCVFVLWLVKVVPDICNGLHVVMCAMPVLFSSALARQWSRLEHGTIRMYVNRSRSRHDSGGAECGDSSQCKCCTHCSQLELSTGTVGVCIACGVSCWSGLDVMGVVQCLAKVEPHRNWSSTSSRMWMWQKLCKWLKCLTTPL